MIADLSYQEVLRTIGAVLEDAGSETANIALLAEAATVSAPGWPAEQVWDRGALEAEMAAQRGWRAVGRHAPARVAGRTSHDLRVVGWMLDAQGVGPYALAVALSAVRVRLPNGEVQTVARSNPASMDA
jgi:hypothetical protein